MRRMDLRCLVDLWSSERGSRVGPPLRRTHTVCVVVLVHGTAGLGGGHEGAFTKAGAKAGGTREERPAGHRRGRHAFRTVQMKGTGSCWYSAVVAAACGGRRRHLGGA